MGQLICRFRTRGGMRERSRPLLRAMKDPVDFDHALANAVDYHEGQLRNVELAVLILRPGRPLFGIALKESMLS